MTNISQINSRNLPVMAQGAAVKTMGQTDFLRLMTTQLKEQDPFNPVDNQAMVAQMAQFSSVAGISEMNISLKGIADQISAQTALLSDIRSATKPTAQGA
ncbi:flagellar hook capping protein [Nostoc sp. HG1]|nr:flagellar hook capping protein [Nostoc sp. HG1]